LGTDDAGRFGSGDTERYHWLASPEKPERMMTWPGLTEANPISPFDCALQLGILLPPG
jgi:hypothetical protein